MTVTQPTAEAIQQAWDDPKLANILYHDWEAGTYDEKWSISFDERCIAYAVDRFRHVAGEQGWPYADRSMPSSPKAVARVLPSGLKAMSQTEPPEPGKVRSDSSRRLDTSQSIILLSWVPLPHPRRWSCHRG